jgi:hypothetical protein
MKNIFTKASVLLSAVALVAGVGIQANANAAGAQTACTYKLIGGAPWAPTYKTDRYSGHITCPATSHEVIGGYALVSQSHL